MHPTPNRLLRAPEAAECLGLSVSTLAKLRLSGLGPRFIKLSRVVAYDARDLDAWTASRKRTSTSDQGNAALSIPPNPAIGGRCRHRSAMPTWSCRPLHPCAITCRDLRGATMGAPMDNTGTTTIYVTTAEAAQLLRISARTLERLRLIGGGPRFRAHGRRILYARDDLMAWSDARAY